MNIAYRIDVAGLVLICCGCVAGMVSLALVGSDVPQALGTMGLATSGALVGLLAKRCPNCGADWANPFPPGPPPAQRFSGGAAPVSPYPPEPVKDHL